MKKSSLPPSALHIECGSKTDRGLKAYREFLKSGTESEREYLAKTVDITPETWELGKQAYKNILEYGAPTWYEWCIVHWGTKWNAYGFEDNTAEKPSSELYFQTAWDAPHALLTRLSEMYPDVTFEYEWADENIGSNCGSKKLLNGEILDEFFPAGKQAMDFAMNLWGYEPVDLELVLNRTGTGYINVEMEEFELIELFDTLALFSSKRVNAADVPDGLYCYKLRYNDDGNSFISIEPRVVGNFAGSVITDTPINIGEKGYISFTKETLPTFLGIRKTFTEFMSGDFEFAEGQNTNMEDMNL